MNFINQKNRYKATKINSKWRHESTSAADSVRSGSAASIKRLVSNDRFRSFAKQAYSSKHGYAIRENKSTGEKEMFVRGTTFKRGGIEWVQNVLESPASALAGGGFGLAGDVSRHIRNKHAKFLGDIARKNNVDVIYGHSRGAAIVEEMHVPGAVKLGLDGATLLNRHTTISNYRQRQAFDGLIGVNSRKTILEDKWTPIYSKRYHSVYSK